MQNTKKAQMNGFFEKAAQAVFLTLIFETAWLGSGTRAYFFMPMFVCAFASLALAYFALNKAEKTDFLKFPILLTGTGFAALGIIQYLNAKGAAVYAENFSYIAGEKFIKCLPTSIKDAFSNGNSIFASAKIFAAAMAATSAHFLFRNKKFRKTAMIFLAANIALVALYAIIQKRAGIKPMFGIFYSDSDIYGTFFLSNAGGAFLCLGMALWLALSARFAKSGSITLCVISALAATLCFASAVYSESYGAAMSAGLLVATIPLIWIFKRWGKTAGFAATASAALALSACAYAAMPHIPSDLKCKMEESAASRWQFYKTTLGGIGENPVYGVGGGSFGRTMGMATIKSRPDKSGSYKLAAHAHSDILNYLAEYGLLGVLLAMPAMFFFAKQARRNFKNFDSGSWIAISGLAISVLHSSIDQHLSIPSTMIAFAIIAVWGIGFTEGNECAGL